MTLAMPSDRKSDFTKSVSYRIAPAFELVARFAPLDPAAREARKIALNENEFVADGVDGLAITAFVHRKDLRNRPDDAVAQGEITLAQLTGPEAADYRLEEDRDFGADRANAGRRRFFLRANRPLMNSAARAGLTIGLRLEGRVNPPQDGKRAHHAPLSVPPSSTPISPCYPLLKIWVAPAEETGRSDVAAFVALPDKNWLPLPGVPARMWVETNGEPYIYRLQPAEAATNAEGVCRWQIGYAGLRWDNLAGLHLTAHCSLGTEEDPQEWTYFDICPYANVAALLKAIVDDAQRLKLNNPYFEADGGYPWTSLAPEIFRGPAYNFFKMLEISADFAESFFIPTNGVDDTYVCSEMRDRIYGALADRRFGASDAASIETMERMNGVEISQYRVPQLHHWAGVHLSGSQPDDDPRFIDPWWRQTWPESNLHPEQLMTWKWELANLTAVAASLTVLAAVLFKMLAPYLTTLGRSQINQLLRRLALWLAGVGMSGAGLNAAKLMAGADNEANCPGGVYKGYKNYWIGKFAIPHLKASGQTVVTPACKRSAP